MVDAVRLPEDVERGASGGPSFSTLILDGVGGVEQRNIGWTRRRGKWNIGYGLQSLTDSGSAIRTVIALHHAQMGRAYAFQFKDWADYQATNQALGTGDGTKTDFQLVKVYSNGASRTFSRIITQPLSTSIEVKVGETLESGWTLQPGGIIRFTTAPAASAAVTASFEFYVPVRFDSDDLTVAVNAFNVGSVPTILIREVIE